MLLLLRATAACFNPAVSTPRPLSCEHVVEAITDAWSTISSDAHVLHCTAAVLHSCCRTAYVNSLLPYPTESGEIREWAMLQALEQDRAGGEWVLGRAVRIATAVLNNFNNAHTTSLSACLSLDMSAFLYVRTTTSPYAIYARPGWLALCCLCRATFETDKKRRTESLTEALSWRHSRCQTAQRYEHGSHGTSQISSPPLSTGNIVKQSDTAAVL